MGTGIGGQTVSGDCGGAGGRALALCDQVGPFDLVLYNAGMDPFDSGVSKGMLEIREQKVAEWAAAGEHPLVFALAGGYTSRLSMAELVDLHLLTVGAFA